MSLGLGAASSVVPSIKLNRQGLVVVGLVKDEQHPQGGLAVVPIQITNWPSSDL